MRRPAEVVHITTAHPPGDNRIYRKECTALHEAGIDVVLVCAVNGPLPDGEVPIVRLPRRPGRIGRMMLGPWDAWRVVRRLDPRVIHVHDPELIPLAALWARRRGKSSVFDAHEDLPKQVAGKPYLPRWSRPVVARAARLLEVIADRGCTAVVAATGPIAKNFRKAPVTLVQNFPWLRDYPEPNDAPRSGRLSVCYVGGISPDRGLTVMLAAMHKLPNVDLILAGPASASARSEIQTADLSNVRYLGVLPPSRVGAVIARSQAGLAPLRPMPNYVESQPTKVFEYMAARRPFIASNFPFWRTLLGEEAGLFVDASDPSAMAAAIRQLTGEPELAATMGARGRERVEQRFTFDGEAQPLVALTRALLASAGS